MAGEAKALRTVQYAAQLRLDAIYADLTISVRAMVDREINDDATLLRDRADEAAILAGLIALLTASRPTTAAVIAVGYGAALKAADPLTRFVAPPAALYLPALAGHDANVITQSLTLIGTGLRQGLTSAVIAKRVADYFSPWFSPRRDETGALKRADRTGAVASWPGQAGMASAGARTLAQTEATLAHGQAMRGLARREDSLLHWRVAPGHRDADRCDDIASADLGHGPGVYHVDELPPYPSHPRCRCTLETVA